MNKVFSPPHIHDSARWNGKRVGLLGGSFNPPHIGHVHASIVAYRSLKLDVIWWLVTPQNPLKDEVSRSFQDRLEMCRRFVAHNPEIIVTDLEGQLRTNLTWLTLSRLRRQFPKTDFVWVTGIDNALTMHRWNHWRRILATVPTAHVARPPALDLIESCPLKMLSQQNHVFVDRPIKAQLTIGNTYWLLQKQLMDISSTKIRKSDS